MNDLITSNSFTCNACKLCAPLGACIAFKGIEGALPMLHGSQGCATYIRRYLISHFREPIDIASSNFSEETTIFGGNKNFNISIDNIIQRYAPSMIGIASTCLSETIGEDVQRLINEYKAISSNNVTLPKLIFASTPSYQGTHYNGFHIATYAVIEKLTSNIGEQMHTLNIFNNMISPEDIRHLKEIVADFGINAMFFPDYSDTLDGESWDEYQRISPGGTSVASLQRSGLAYQSIELGYILNSNIHSKREIQSVGEYLYQKYKVANNKIGIPIGIRETDIFFNLLSEHSQKPIPLKYIKQRGRLVDLYIDGHKYVSKRKVVIYGEEDLVIAIASFAAEIGMDIILCATGGESGKLKDTIMQVLGNMYQDEIIVKENLTFEQMDSMIPTLKPDVIIGNSKGYYIARKYNIPIVRIGFPIHDRIGAQHVRLLSYEGTTVLFELLVNTLIEEKQRSSSYGYKYI